MSEGEHLRGAHFVALISMGFAALLTACGWVLGIEAPLAEMPSEAGPAALDSSMGDGPNADANTVSDSASLPPPDGAPDTPAGTWMDTAAGGSDVDADASVDAMPDASMDASSDAPTAGDATDGSTDAPTDVADVADSGPPTECPVGRTSIWRGDPQAMLTLAANPNMSLVSDPVMGRVLRAAYLKGMTGGGGSQFIARLPNGTSLDSVFLTFWIKMDAALPVQSGGKLPGLCGGNCPTGSGTVSGSGGWSIRFMWKANGAGLGGENPRVYPTLADFDGSWMFAVGAWHHLQEELLLNHGGASDGRVRVWYDKPPTSTPDLDRTGMSYRSDGTGADSFLFTTYLFATPANDTFADFAKFEVCQ
jgi:hypothetical protein